MGIQAHRKCYELFANSEAGGILEFKTKRNSWGLHFLLVLSTYTHYFVPKSKPHGKPL